MRYIVASDIHGSAYYTERLLERVREEQGERLLLLGDIYNHGPRNPFPEEYAPMRVAALLNAQRENLIVIRGNCDSEVDAMISEFSFVPESILPFDGRKLFLTHGHIHNPRNLPALNAGDIFLYGHTHVGVVEESAGVYLINPGSVSLPKDGQHSYVLLTEQEITRKDVKTGKALAGIRI